MTPSPNLPLSLPDFGTMYLDVEPIEGNGQMSHLLWGNESVVI